MCLGTGVSKTALERAERALRDAAIRLENAQDEKERAAIGGSLRPMNDYTNDWYLAWARLALTPSITNRGDGSRPRRDWLRVGAYAEKRKALARQRMISADNSN